MVVWCGTEAGAVGGSIVFMGWCLCCYRGGCWFGERAEGAGSVAVGGAGCVVIGEKEQAVERRVVWCYMSGWDS